MQKQSRVWKYFRVMEVMKRSLINHVISDNSVFVFVHICPLRTAEYLYSTEYEKSLLGTSLLL